MLFTEILKKQLLMKGIIVEEDWQKWQNDLAVDYVRDNHFSELKDTEILQNRLQTLDNVQQYVGEFFSKEWVMKNILQLEDDDLKQMKEQIAQEKQSGEIPNDEEEPNDAAAEEEEEAAADDQQQPNGALADYERNRRPN
jgi:hypothetical protein